MTVNDLMQRKCRSIKENTSCSTENNSKYTDFVEINSQWGYVQRKKNDSCISQVDATLKCVCVQQSTLTTCSPIKLQFTSMSDDNLATHLKCFIGIPLLLLFNS